MPLPWITTSLLATAALAIGVTAGVARVLQAVDAALTWDAPEAAQ